MPGCRVVVVEEEEVEEVEEEEEEEARIFLNERLPPSSPHTSARCPPPARHSPAPLRGAASFYSDGAEPPLLRVVTKPAARGRADTQGKRLPRPPAAAAPRQVTQRGAPRSPAGTWGSPG